MAIAIIDLGTNTFNLLIAEIGPSGTHRIIHTDKKAVSLGNKGISNNKLLPDAIERGIAALTEYKKVIEAHGVEKIYSFATSAIREAENKDDFLILAKAAGINISVVSGNLEAELIYEGVKFALDFGNKPALIMDIGGGSTEFIIAGKGGILWKQSYLLGVTRLLEKFNPSDPYAEKEIRAIEEYLREQLTDLTDAVRNFPVAELIGSSGSFDSFAEIIACNSGSPIDLENNTEYEYKMDQAHAVFEDLIHSDRKKREQMKGLVKLRVDMIVMAALLARFILTEFRITKMRLSTYSLKEGVLSQLLNIK